MPDTEEPEDPPVDEDGEDDEPGRVDELRTTAEGEIGSLQRGRTVPFLGASVPVRVLVALGIFVLVFTLVWLVLWALGGTLGLALGWIPAAFAGVLAIRLANHGSP